MTDTPTEREEQGAWAKLRHRKVVQWALAYAAGAWALLQGLTHVVATFHWPEQVQQVGTLLLPVGLPIVVTLAWYHGDRGQQRVTRPEARGANRAVPARWGDSLVVGTTSGAPGGDELRHEARRARARVIRHSWARSQLQCSRSLT